MASAMAHKNMRYMSPLPLIASRASGAPMNRFRRLTGRVARVRSEAQRFADGRSGSGEIRLAEREERRGRAAPARDAENRAKEVVQVAQPVAFRRFRIGADGALAACQYWCASAVCCASSTAKTRKKRPRRPDMAAILAPDYFARHSSRPAMKRSFGSFLPMNTSSELLLLGLAPTACPCRRPSSCARPGTPRGAGCPSSTGCPCSAGGPGRRPGSCRRGIARASAPSKGLSARNTNDSTSSWCSCAMSVRKSGSSSRIAFRLKPRMSSTSSIGALPKCTCLIGARGFILRQALRKLLHLVRRGQIGLGHQDPVGEADLLLRLVEFVELLRRVLGVDHVMIESSR